MCKCFRNDYSAIISQNHLKCAVCLIIFFLNKQKKTLVNINLFALNIYTTKHHVFISRF